MMFRIFLLSALILSGINSIAQENLEEYQTTPLIDSLLSVINEEKKDTITVNQLNDLAYEYHFIGKKNQSLKYINKALSLARELDWNKGRGKAFSLLGSLHYSKSEYDSAITFFERSIAIADSFNLKSLKASVLVNLSNVYSEKSEFSKALSKLFEGLKIIEELNDEERVGGTLINIGIVFFYQGEYDTAMQYYERASHIFKNNRDYKNLSFAYNNMAGIYAYKGKFTKALFFYRETANYKAEYNDFDGLCIAYQNIAQISNYLSNFSEDSLRSFQDIYKYADLNNLKASLQDTARSYLKKSVKIARETNSPYNIMQGLSTLGSIYVLNDEYDKGLKSFKDALKMAIELDVKQNISDIYNHIFEVYLKIGKYDSALHYNILRENLKDSIYSVQKQQEIGRQKAQYTYEKKQALQEVEYQKQLALDKEELKRQRLAQVFLASIIIIVLIVSIVIYRALRISRKRKKEIEDQKMIIEKKNLETLSSIRYASRIQNALLKEEETLVPILPKHFVFFEPRDIVSGDFYWSVKQDDWWYLAVADCTGHGVPGAFLTMLGTAYLNEIISTEIHIPPDLILNQLREKIVSQLSQSEDIEDSKDGMDISIIAINLKTLKAEWAGANNPIYIVRKKRDEDIEIMENENAVLAEIKGDKQPIGYSSIQKPFTKHHINFKKGELFYLISDGFPDQFGGPRNKKYRYKPLKQLILNISDSDITKQKEIISKEFHKWKGNQEQIDDVCILGVRI